MCDTLLTTVPQECHVLFEWPITPMDYLVHFMVYNSYKIQDEMVPAYLQFFSGLEGISRNNDAMNNVCNNPYPYGRPGAIFPTSYKQFWYETIFCNYSVRKYRWASLFAVDTSH